MTNAPTGLLVAAALMAWAIYRRVRRNIGRQPLQPTRLIVRLVILGLATLIMLAWGIFVPAIGGVFLVGALVGAGCSFLGLRHTKFETTEQGHFYTPNTYIGIALSTLLIGRMAYRIIVATSDQAAPQWTPGQPVPMQLLITFGIAGLTIGYYLSYNIGLVRHTRDRPAAPAA